MTNGKVKLTKEQNAALSSYIFHYGANQTKEQAMHVDSFAEPYESLNRLSYLTIGQAINLGWEVIEEPSFAPGDIVVTPKGHVVLLVRDLGGSEYYSKVLYSADYSVGENGRVDLKKGNIRKATATEVFFAKLGRREYDFRDGDIFVDIAETYWDVGEEITLNDAIRWFDTGDCAGVIPEGSLVKFEGGNE